MDRQAISALTAEAVARYDRSDDAVDQFFDEAWSRLAPEGDEAILVAMPYAEGGSSAERAAAAEIIGRVGEANHDPVKEKALDVLFGLLLTEKDADVRDALAAGVCLIWGSRGDEAAPLALIRHPNANVRYAVANYLGLSTTDAPEDAAHRAALEVLKDDPDEGVRMWALFGLETLTL